MHRPGVGKTVLTHSNTPNFLQNCSFTPSTVHSEGQIKPLAILHQHDWRSPFQRNHLSKNASMV
jgi:hypothetical protein